MSGEHCEALLCRLDEQFNGFILPSSIFRHYEHNLVTGMFTFHAPETMPLDTSTDTMRSFHHCLSSECTPALTFVPHTATESQESSCFVSQIDSLTLLSWCKVHCLGIIMGKVGIAGCELLAHNL